MARNRTTLVLQIDGDRLLAVVTNVSDDRIAVRSWITATKPASTAVDDAETMGRWVADELSRANVKVQQLVVALPRAAVILKHLSIPAALGVGESINAVAFQMARGMALPTSAIVADFVPAAATSTQPGMADVLAGAIGVDRVRWWEKFAASANLKLERIGVAAFGAALAAGAHAEGAVLVLAPGLASMELLIVEDSSMILARSADIARPQTREEVDVVAQRAAVEAKRTWMGYTAGASKPIGAVRVLAQGELAEALCARCREALDVNTAPVHFPAWLSTPDAMPEAERWAAVPLAALLREDSLDRHSVDFVNPRKAPDLSARKRQFALAGAFGIMMIAGTIYVLADRRIAELDDQKKALQGQQAELSKQMDQYLARHARLQNLKAWSTTSTDWTDHIAVLASQIPKGGTARLDELSGASITFVTPSPKGSTYDTNCKWASSVGASFRLRGQVNARDVATALRARLLEGELYTVDTQGAETADNFNIVLTTSVPAPTKFVKPSSKTTDKSATADTKKSLAKPEAKPESKTTPPPPADKSTNQEVTK